VSDNTADSTAGADSLIARGALATASGFLIRFGARLAFLFVAGRLFGPSLYGAYSLAVAAIEASVGLAGLSLKKTLFQLLDADDRAEVPVFHRILDAIVLVALTSALVAAAIMTATAVLPATTLAPATAAALFWIAPMVAGQAIVDILFAATRWTHAVRYEVIGRSLVEPYALLFGTVVAFVAGFHQTGLILGYWVGNVAVNIYAVVGLRRCYPGCGLAGYRPTRRLWRMGRALLHNTGSDFLSAISSRVDLYLVGLLLGERWAGIYGMAQQIRTPLRQVRQSFDGLLVPMVARTLAAKGAAATVVALASAARLILAIQLPFLILIVAVGAPLLELFGAGFSIGYGALVLLTIAEAVQGTLGLGDLLFVYLRPRTGFAITLSGFVCAVTAGIMMIPTGGISAAAGAMLLAATLQAALRRVAFGRFLEVLPPIRPLALPLMAGSAGLAMALATRSLGGPGGMIATAAGLATYALILGAATRRHPLAIRGFATAPIGGFAATAGSGSPPRPV